ncbi:VanZ family protein [Haloferula rosea]|uniref:VanZ family protein n=1 Tax=Haloferula rosea TaxID=490093 RepID=A0A934VAD0_9BACT|nr:VanZ family protein [Haloferula rosea]MBK1826173.1 VanZ family protein [Haloferula rosea]
MRLPRHAGIWFAGFTLWFCALWWLSSRVHHVPPPLTFQASDKVLHFGYFFGGAGLLSAAMFRWRPLDHPWKRVVLVTVIVTLVGVLDEYHQSLVPGRHGNDIYDLTADFLGALTGAILFLPFRRMLAD